MWHYEIPKSHLADESRREEWLSHLEQKRWFTPEVRAAVLAVTA